MTQALRNAAEQFVAAHADGNAAEMLDYFADIFAEALAAQPQAEPKMEYHGFRKGWLPVEPEAAVAQVAPLSGGWFIDRAAFNEPMFRTFDKMLSHAKRARWVNVVVRKDGVETTYEADWIKHMRLLEPSIEVGRQTEPAEPSSAIEPTTSDERDL